MLPTENPPSHTRWLGGSVWGVLSRSDSVLCLTLRGLLHIQDGWELDRSVG